MMTDELVDDSRDELVRTLADGDASLLADLSAA